MKQLVNQPVNLSSQNNEGIFRVLSDSMPANTGTLAIPSWSSTLRKMVELGSF